MSDDAKSSDKPVSVVTLPGEKLAGEKLSGSGGSASRSTSSSPRPARKRAPRSSEPKEEAPKREAGGSRPRRGESSDTEAKEQKERRPAKKAAKRARRVDPPKESENTESSEQEAPTRERAKREPAKRDEQRSGGRGRGRSTAPNDEVYEKAWLLYSRELIEDGVDVTDKSDAKKLAKKSFDLARIFIEEAGR